MGDPTGEADKGALRLDFDRRLLLQFRGSTITSDAGLLAYRELDDTLALTDTGADTLADARTGKNGRHRLVGMLRQSVCSGGCAATRRCAGWSATGRSPGLPPRPARWAGSRRSG
jgi:Transposase DDE domain group 1